MTRCMFSGVSGLKAHQSKMDVIGNNVANVNTVAFKSGRVTFSEVFSETMRGAGAPDSTSGRGGTNPMQMGLGLGVGTVDTLMTRGSMSRTDNPKDLAIEGDGFFIVKGGSGDMFRFTRAGNFEIDKLGNSVTGSGMNVYGWQQYDVDKATGEIKFNTEKPIEPINLYSDVYNKNKRMIAAKATSSAVFAGNLDSSKLAISTAGAAAALDNIGTSPATPHFKIPVIVYDSLGNDYEVNIKMSKCYIDTTNAPASATNPITSWYYEVEGTPGSATPAATGYLKFDKNGQIIPEATGSYQTKPSIIFTPVAATTGTAPFTVEFDFTKLTMYDADSSVKPTNVNGYKTGKLVTFNIGSDGIITGIYSNGKQQPLGLLSLAGFENPAGLQKVGENMYVPTTNSGDFQKAMKAGSEGVGMLSPCTLEMSNVDLSREFTEMIVTQRGFQANSRIITTSDEMLQELVNLKR